MEETEKRYSDSQGLFAPFAPSSTQGIMNQVQFVTREIPYIALLNIHSTEM